MMPIHTAKTDTPCFELKGSVMTVLVLHLKGTDADSLYPQLEKKMGKAQAFFRSAPLLIDLNGVSEEEQEALDFAALAATLRNFGVVPVGVRGGAALLDERILATGIGILPAVKAKRTVETPEEEPAVESPAADTPPAKEEKAQLADGEKQPPSHAPTKVISHPVRSGQQIVAPDGDLVLLSSVNAGAEVLAAGNIHLYGALRGRALAGINGDTTARIISLQCNPELVAIAGEYLVNESLDRAVLNQSVVISLGEGGLHFDITGSFTPAS